MSNVDTITKVVFRKWKDGDIIALFPEDKEGTYTIGSYMHIGQHGGANYDEVMGVTKPATLAEYMPLKRELENSPYNYKLKVMKRCQPFFRK